MMSELSAHKVELKKDRKLTQSAFERLLSWLDQGGDSGGHKYLEMRQRLAAYFDRKNCATPDELADETLNRVARRLEEEGVTVSDAPARYCYIVARHVFLESLRGAGRENMRLEDLRREPRGASFSAAEADDERRIKEKMLDCLERCVGELEPQSRELIVRYYSGKERIKIENRRALAQSLEITVNALSVRACRIRDKLEACVKRCVGEG
jgi:DNA-directed RNA polymerase specialized sigma24 family protein